MNWCLLFIHLWVSNIIVNYSELKPTKTEVYYGNRYKLQWSDFRVKNLSDNTVSESETSIGYSFNGVKVTVFCKFHKDESYVSPKGINGYILNHEQRHFDITYIYSRKLVEKLSQQPTLTQEIIDSIYDKILLEKEAAQDQYDKETNNSENKQVQGFWDKKIDNLLNSIK